MGITNTDNEHDLEMHTVRDEESLPLYSEVSGIAPDAVPAPEASPDAVREFFKNLLVAKRQDSLEDAEALAALWTRGSGKELKSYPPAMYLKIFGSEDGWFLYKETQMLIRTKTPEQLKRAKAGNYIFLASTILWELAMLAIILKSSSPGLLTFAILAIMFGGFAVIGAICMCLEVGQVVVEKQIEGELRTCMDRQGSNESS